MDDVSEGKGTTSPSRDEAAHGGVSTAGAAADTTGASGGVPWAEHYPDDVSLEVEVPNTAIPAILEETVRRHPQRDATVFFGASLTYQELWEQVQAFAAALQDLGVEPGDRVAIMLPNSPQSVIAFFGTLLVGGVVVEVNPLYTERELAHQMKDSGAAAIIGLDALHGRIAGVREETDLRHVILTRVQDYLPFFLRLLYPIKQWREGNRVHIDRDADVLWLTDIMQGDTPEPVDLDPRSTALLQYTGGTTGRAKGAELSHRNLVANVEQIDMWFGDAVEHGQETMISVLPFFHVYGLTACMNFGIKIGATQLLVPRFEPEEILDLIQRYRPTMFPAAPTIYVALLGRPEVTEVDMSSIGPCISGSAPLPQQVQTEFQDQTHSFVVEGYGLTEASPVTHCNPLNESNRIGSIGLPLPGTQCQVVDLEEGTEEVSPGERGELIVRGPQVMKGYWDRPETTEPSLRDGWLYTGDVATMDEDGFFRIVDRKTDMIIASGYNVYPREVEDVLYEHPEVEEAAVFGVPDDYRGETVMASLVLKSGAAVTEDDIIAFSREHLAAYKIPRIVEFRDELPKTAVGKVLRRELADDAAEGDSG